MSDIEINSDSSEIQRIFDSVRNTFQTDYGNEKLEDILLDIVSEESSLGDWKSTFLVCFLGHFFSYNKEFECCKDKEKEESVVDFIFSCGEEVCLRFLNNSEISIKDKFYSFMIKYILISRLPEKFKDIKNQETNILYNNYNAILSNYAEYINSNNLNDFILVNSLSIIIKDIFSKINKTDYTKDTQFIIDIFKSIPILNKDRIINFQGQPLFNKLVQGFLENPSKNKNILEFFKNSIKDDPFLVYKFSTTSDNTNHNYELIENNKDFSRNFICNFPAVFNDQGNITYGETRCQPNVLSEILFALNSDGISKDDKKYITQMLSWTLDSLCKHVEHLKEVNDFEEIQKIHYLLNCPIKDEHTEEFLTPMDFILKVTEFDDEVLNVQQKNNLKDYVVQLEREPAHLCTMKKIKSSIEFKQAVAGKIKEEKSKEKPIPLNKDRSMEEMFTPEVLENERRDKEETEKGNKEIKKLQDKLKLEEEKTKLTIAYKFFNALSKFFLGRETEYKTKQQIKAEKNLSEKMIELSKSSFIRATDVSKQQMLDLSKQHQQERNINYDNNMHIDL